MAMSRLFRPLALALMASTAPCLAHAGGNAYSFSRAQASAVDYRATPHHAVVACTGLAASADVARQTAVLVPAAGATPEHCRVNGVLTSGAGFQVNLPTAWNGRLYMYGNGGYAGEDAEGPREQASRSLGLANGFATARTDTGHLAASEPLATFAGDRQKLVNHGYQAVHDTVGFAKRLAVQFYGLAPTRSYWDGCSTGGREGVMSAQRYPTDFDGIVAAAPTLDWSSIMIKGLWNARALEGSGLTIAKMDVVFRAVMRRCDALDGQADGLIDDPRRCDFNPRRDLPSCADQAGSLTCFTGPEVAALEKLYAGPPKGKGTPDWDYLVPGFEHASTVSPFTLMPDGSSNVLKVFGDSWVKHIGFRDPQYDPKGFDFVEDPTKIRGADLVFNPTPDLAAFRARGGKMITFWGWADTALNPQMGLHYYDQVVARQGLVETQDFYRFFLVPGVAHCAGGYGPDHIDALTEVINWVEIGAPPERLVATRGEAAGDRRRAYCPYPAATVYDGVGPSEDPRSYACVIPAKVASGH